MRKNLVAIVAAASILSGAPLVAQLPVTSLGKELLPVLGRGEAMTLQGEVIEISCYQKKGYTAGAGANHLACAKECVQQGKALGLLSDGDGMFRIVGELTKGDAAKLVPYIGQTVEVRGAEVIISNTYNLKSFEVERITPVKKGG